MPASIIELEKRLWGVADELRANSPLSSWEYSLPVLGLLFLRYADAKFTQAEEELKAKAGKGSRRKIGKAINAAMEAIESRNEDLKGTLPRNSAV